MEVLGEEGGHPVTYVLGIDGGGTKTTGVIANEKGNTIAEATVGASNPNIVDYPHLVKTFSSLVSQLRKKDEDAFKRVSHVFAGVSGAAHSSTKQQLIDVLTEVMPSTSLTVDNDAVIALYSGTMGKAGIVQISGTGSITYGINGQGKRGRIGGWGHFVGERGSGYGLGHDALQAVFSAHDHMGPETALTELIIDHFRVTELSRIIPSIYQANNPKETVASLGRLVMKAADSDDDVAKQIIEQNGLHIGKSITTLIKQLFNPDNDELSGVAEKDVQEKDKTIPVVLAGGLFNRLDLFQQAIKKELQNQLYSVKLIKPDAPPVYGAVIAALGDSSRTSDFPE